MSTVFQENQETQVQYSTFDNSHQHKFTCNAGMLVPSLMFDTTPSEIVKLGINQLMRMQPMLFPVMHQVELTNHCFWVPFRIVWNEKKYTKFFTGGDDGMQQVAFPTISQLVGNSTNPDYHKINRLAEYLGLPPIQDNTVGIKRFRAINPLPFIAYAMIYRDYYRDQNVELYIDEATQERWDDEDLFDITTWAGYPSLDWNALTPGQKSIFTTVRRRAWAHDYFTSALPWPQKGEPVKINLGEGVPVIVTPDPLVDGAIVRNMVKNPAAGALSINPANGTFQANGAPAILDPNGSLIADLTAAEGATIIELRKSIVLQQWLEQKARSGSRIFEYLLSDFKVRLSDGRFMIPEFCGGNKTPVLISEVLQTSSTGGSTTPLGEMAGHGISMGGGYVSNKYSEEHGFFFNLTSVMPKPGYHQGMPKIWTQFDKFDYPTPMFQHVGEQEIRQGEIYYQADNEEDDKLFGYIPRYAQYKFMNNRVSGDFTNTLSPYTWDRVFEEAPTLSKEFIQCTPGRDIFAITDPDEDTLLIQMYFDLKCRRPLSYYSSPGLTRI